MSDGRGTFEHALFDEPRPAHGYCTDDMARVLIVSTRERQGGPSVGALAVLSLTFLDSAQDSVGRFRNRMNQRGGWDDGPTVEDCWGRSIWGLGTAVARSQEPVLGDQAAVLLEKALRQRSPWARATSFAVLGAAELLSVRPSSPWALDFLNDAVDQWPVLRADARWPWPEPRLSYANAVVPDAMVAAGHALERPDLVQRGLTLLQWLLGHETSGGHLSVTPVGGAGPGDTGPAFDQQPIEVAALADACARAAQLDDNPCWLDGVAAAANWFGGDNDAQAVMSDPFTGGGFDGLEPNGPNRNQGTESTLALISTLQWARHLLPVAP
jgi:hypothetical protein